MNLAETRSDCLSDGGTHASDAKTLGRPSRIGSGAPALRRRERHTRKTYGVGRLGCPLATSNYAIHARIHAREDVEIRLSCFAVFFGRVAGKRDALAGAAHE